MVAGRRLGFFRLRPAALCGGQLRLEVDHGQIKRRQQCLSRKRTASIMRNHIVRADHKFVMLIACKSTEISHKLETVPRVRIEY